MKRLDKLLHPAFLLALLLLVMNDACLKPAFHNWLTGKLSDFAGLFAFSFFFMTVTGSYPRLVAVVCALTFAYWKSFLSTGFIAFLNTYAPFPVARVADSTDLFAIAVIPVAYLLYRKPCRVQLPYKSLATSSVALSCLLAFCYTTMAPRQLAYDIPPNEIRFSADYVTDLTKEEVVQRLSRGGAIKKEYERFYPVRDKGSHYYGIGAGDSMKFVRFRGDSNLYVRLPLTDTMLVVPEYIIDGKVLRNIRFSVYTNSRKQKRTSVSIRSFESGSALYPTPVSEQQLSAYRKHFKKLFEQ